MKIVKSKREKKDYGSHKECKAGLSTRKLLSHIDEGLEIVKEMKNGKLAVGRELT